MYRTCVCVVLRLVGVAVAAYGGFALYFFVKPLLHVAVRDSLVVVAALAGLMAVIAVLCVYAGCAVWVSCSARSIRLLCGVVAFHTLGLLPRLSHALGDLSNEAMGALLVAWSLAAYAAYKREGESLASFLSGHIFSEGYARTVLAPDPVLAAGFGRYIEDFKQALAVEETAAAQF